MRFFQWLPLGIAMLPQALDLKYFLQVCECKNISRAADLLGITQPSLSMAMKRLETNAGVKLFVRSKNGVDLTRAGVAFRERSKDLLELWQAISDDMKRSSEELQGRYTLGAHISVALVSLTSVIAELMRLHPELELSVSHGWSRIITDQVISFDVDFALVVNPIEHPDLVIKEIYRDVVGFFARSDCVDESVLIYDTNLLQAQTLLKTIKSLGLKFSRTITSSSLEFIGRLAQEGCGVALLPQRVANYLGEPKISAWNKQLPFFHDKHCLVYRADAQITKSSRTLARELARLLIARVQV